MEDFLHKTRQNFGMIECSMDGHDCTHDWKVIGTLSGQCLTYNPEDTLYPRDAELRISIRGNDSGKLENKNLKILKI